MKIEPIRRYAQPQLPTREVVDENPELLRLLPRRWQANPAVMTAMIGAGLLLQCSGSLLAEDRSRVMGIMAIPVRMTESEARRIIVNEAKKSGIVFVADGKTLEIPLASLDTVAPSAKPEPKAMTRLTLDGTNAKLGVSYEYISYTDETALSARRGGAVATESVAAAIRVEAKEKLKGRVLVIPGISNGQENPERKLRAQVKDFIKWLKAQGVI